MGLAAVERELALVGGAVWEMDCGVHFKSFGGGERAIQMSEIGPPCSRNSGAAIIAAPSHAHQEPSKRLKSPLNWQSRHTRQTQSA